MKYLPLLLLAVATPACLAQANTPDGMDDPPLEAPPSNPPSGNKPNILFIVSDDMNRLVGHLGAPVGVEEFAQPTPNMDKLASEGVSFTQAHVCAPECNPSRTCFMYGESPVDTKVIQNPDDAGNPAVANKENLAAFIARNGYRTVNYQRLFHLGSQVSYKFDAGTFIQGTDGYEPQTGDDRYADPELTSNFDFATIDEPKENHPDWKALQLMLGDMKADAEAGVKGFYAMGFTTCHTPIYNPAEVMAGVEANPPRPPVPEGDFDDIPFRGKQFGKAFQFNAELCLADDELYRQYIRHYYGCIRFADQMVGELMEFVDSQPAEDWMVLVLSDHGFHLIDKVRMSKFTLWSATSQVPLIIRGGPFTGGKLVEKPVSLVDLYKTFSVMFGTEPEHPLDGFDLADIADGGERDPVVVYHKWGKAVINDNFHLITYQDWNSDTLSFGPQDQENYELYAKSDPWQITNLAPSPLFEQLKGFEMGE